MKESWVTKKEFNQAMKGIDRRFDGVERRFTQLIDDRQSELAQMIKAGFDDLSSQLKRQSGILTDHERRLAVVEYALAITKN